MKGKKAISAIMVIFMIFSMILSPMGSLVAKADGTKLIATDSVRKFDLGSEDVGGSGVEGTSNWIKIVQNSNKLKLFDDVTKGTDVAAIQVTFEISNWSGIEFPITWGCNINFKGETGSTWCGTADFSEISGYIINREGEYTVTCDFEKLCSEKGKDGIDWLQTCEMVIGNLTEGDTTIIEIKEAYMYLPGETIPADNAPKPDSSQGDIIVIAPSNVSRTNNGIFEGWGTSLCWYGNRIGISESASKESAELLYNAQTGLGLNIIRYNIGGGDDPSHSHIQRSDSNMPGYWTNYDAATGAFEYDYTLDANQYNVLMDCIAECPDILVEMFSNSAPYFMTRSGCTSGTTDDISSNITIENMTPFAEYMATVVKHYVDKGINVVSIEPMNEPSNGWNVAHYGVKQEGCSIAKGEEQSAMIIAMKNAMDKFGLSNIALSGCDETNDTTTNQALKKLSDEALAALSQINTHTYSRNASSSTRLYQTAYTLRKNLWMSESDSGNVQGENAGEMGAALNLASQITNDLNALSPSAWIIWQAIGSYCDSNNEFDPDTLDQKTLDTNGFWGVCYADMNNETIVKTKKYYAFGQYTKFIRPGDSLISTEDSYTTAAFNEEDGQIKIVTYNTDSNDREVTFDLSAFTESGTTVNVIRTSGDYATGENWTQLSDLKVEDGKVHATIKGNSVTTFVVNGAKHDITSEIQKELIIEDNDSTGNTDETPLADNRIMPTEKNSIGQICFASSDWSYTVMSEDAATKTGIEISTMKNGKYSIVLPAPTDANGNSSEVLGSVVFCVDLVGYAKYITGIDATTLKSDDDISAYNTQLAETVKAKNITILMDGEELTLDATKVIVGDTEQNGNLRIEFYNMYGPSAENAAIDPEEISFKKELTINFELELAEIDENSGNTDNTPSTDDTSSTDNEDNATKEPDNNLIVYIIIGLVVIGVSVIAGVVLKTKKK